MARPGPNQGFTTIRKATPKDKNKGSITLNLHDASQWDSVSGDVRAEDGRDQEPIEITFEAELPDGRLFTETARQHQGDPYFNVIRQEYEDVVNVGPFDRMPSSDEFSSEEITVDNAKREVCGPDSSNQISNWDDFELPIDQFGNCDPDDFQDYGYESYIFPDVVETGLENARDRAVEEETICPTDGDGMVMMQPFEECLNSDNDGYYFITSNYRYPVYNQEVDGANNSSHLYGKGFDFYVTDEDGNPIHPWQFIRPSATHVNNWSTERGFAWALCEWGGANGFMDLAYPNDNHIHLGWPRQGENPATSCLGSVQ